MGVVECMGVVNKRWGWVESMAVVVRRYHSARNNCGYKTLRFLHFYVIFFRIRFLIM